MVWAEAPLIRAGSVPERVGLVRHHEGLPRCLNYDTLPKEVEEKPLPYRQCKGEVSFGAREQTLDYISGSGYVARG